MADKLSAEQRHSCMSHNRANNTKPEVLARKKLFADGYRFRINVKRLPGTPDIVLPKYRTCIFVNGCFWHGHKGCKHYTVPETNRDFWVEKVRNNQERDMRVTTQLESLNWNVITIWECELKKNVIDRTIVEVEAALAGNKVKWETYLSRRKADREFAKAEAKRHKEIRALVEKELQEQFHIPVKIRKMSETYED